MRTVFRSVTMMMFAGIGVFISGCGPSTYPVDGVVLLDTAPVASATVVFQGAEANNGQSFSAVSGLDGSFKLNDGKGIPAGSYRVLVTKTAVTGSNQNIDPTNPAAMKMMVSQMKGASSGGGPKNSLPAKYSKPDTTLLIKIPAETQPLKLELTSK